MKRNDQSCKPDLESKLAWLSGYTTPGVHILRTVLRAYQAYVSELEKENAAKDERIGAEVKFQYSIREQERAARAEQYERHQEEKRRLIQDLGFAATAYNRALEAQRQGRKTIKIDVLLEGKPADGDT